MSTKNILIWVIVGIIILLVVSLISVKTADLPNGEGKLKVANFSGKLESINEGCYADGECFVVIQGKHVTVTMGWSQEIVGSVIGVPSFADLKSHIGEEFEVYAQDKGDGTYTLYGSEGFYIKDVVIGENLDGEADPDRMSLTMKKWIWQESEIFSITFQGDGKFSVTTDCNSMGGNYVADKAKGSISFKDMYATEMYCENSRESEFAGLLQNAIGYHFTSRGQLYLDLKSGNSAIFR